MAPEKSTPGDLAVGDENRPRTSNLGLNLCEIWVERREMESDNESYEEMESDNESYEEMESDNESYEEMESDGVTGQDSANRYVFVTRAVRTYKSW
ncbi:hypothetical protein DdX_19189 [Ditylenchus destructor]|uniref:Uncharacterized protein n=1 Tax=Ditylenchus destructor TaxID=166010 RepID=A0AAD4QXD0_9BILA|nr:hypothetical protein DdX_19189 [Ditylenchus destructor]